MVALEKKSLEFMVIAVFSEEQRAVKKIILNFVKPGEESKIVKKAVKKMDVNGTD